MHCTWPSKQEELDRMVQRSGVRAFLGADFVTAETDRPGHVTRAVIEDKSGRRAIAARFFIDCSGDADLVARAGFETWKPPREAYGALRVMVNCNQMGEAAGCAAAKAVKEHLAAADAYPGFVSAP